MYLFLDSLDNLKIHLLPYLYFKEQYEVFWWQLCICLTNLLSIYYEGIYTF